MNRKIFLPALFFFLLINLINAGVEIKKPKVLILTLNHAGGAHMSTAKAIADTLKDRCDCKLISIDEYQSFSSYEYVMRYSFLRIFYNMHAATTWRIMSIIPQWYFGALKPNLLAFLSTNIEDKHIVISVVPFANRLVLNTIREHSPGTKFIIIPTDLHDPLINVGRSFGTFWLDPESSEAVYLLGSDKLIQQAHNLNLYNIYRTSGIIIKKEFTELNKTKEELRQELGIPADKRVVLFLFGSCGSTEMIQLMKLMHRSDHYCVFICGKSQEIKRKLEELDVDKKHHILGFVENIPKLMGASDVCIGKAGTTVVSECIASKLPLIVKDGLDVMLQEQYNVEYIRDNKLGATVRKWQELPKLLEEMFGDYPTYQEAIARIPKNNALAEVCDVIQRE